MKNGQLNAREISKLAGVYQTLQTLIEAGASDAKPCSTEMRLVDARNSVATIIRSQSYKIWEELQAPKGGAQ